MSNKISIATIIIYLTFIPNSASAKFIPKDFEHFYSYSDDDLVFYLPNNKRKIIKVVSNIDQIKKIYNIGKFKQYLLDSGIKKNHIQNVISAVLKNNNSDVKINYNFDKKSIEIKVPSDFMVSKSKSSSFTNAESDETALITRSRLYASSYDGEFDASINNYSIIGFDKSHISLDSRFSTTGDPIVIDSTSYVRDFKGASLLIGYSSYGSEIVNSTSVFDYSSGDDEYRLSFFSNDNLLIGDKSTTGRIYFDMKANGSYRVKREGKIIYTDSVLKGQNFISYNKLPVGIYQIQIELRPDGMPQEVITKQVVNVSSITSKRGFDYNLSYSSSEKKYEDNDYSDNYITASGTYSLYDDRLLVGSNFSYDGNNSHYGIGLRFLLNDISASSYIENLSNDGLLFAFNSSLYGFNFDYKNVDIDDLQTLSDLTVVRYGDHSYKQTNISYSFPFFNSSIGFFASRYEEYIGDNNEKNTTDNISINYNRSIFKNTQLTLSYGLNSSNDYDEYTLGASVNIPLDDKFNYNSSYEYSSKRGTRFDNTIDYNSDLYIEDVEFNNNINLTETVNRNNSNILFGASSTAQNDYFSGNAFVSISDDNYSNLTLSANSTSIITKDSINFTKDDADSFILVKNENKELDVVNDLGLIDLHKDNSYRQRQAIKGGSTIVPIDNYSDYQISLDNEVSGYKEIERNSGTAEMFSYPGTVKIINNKVREVVTFLTYFEDFNDEAVNDIKCKGDGCVAVNKVGNGIYNISVVKDNDFKLTYNNQICLIDSDVINHNKDASRCFPSISEQPNGLQIVTRGFKSDDNEVVYYLGVKDNKIPNDLAATLKNMNMSVVEYPFNKKVHLFVKVSKEINVNSEMMVTTMDVLTQVQKYASTEKNIGNYTRLN
ncbi:TPA: TcfC E-set like domain-containing protein [Photobacterium damselae]